MARVKGGAFSRKKLTNKDIVEQLEKDECPKENASSILCPLGEMIFDQYIHMYWNAHCNRV